MTSMRIYSIGHSNREIDGFLGLLERHDVRGLADVRRHPESRRHPHFCRAALASSCAANGIEYRHASGLGGFRREQEDSPHRAWEEAGFRGYADYMETAPFAAALAELVEWSTERGPIALMCAEANPRSCHRQLLCDALVRDGVDVLHIAGDGSLTPHTMPAFARVEGGRIIYDGGTLPLG